jgi:hypothetical protein
VPIDADVIAARLVQHDVDAEDLIDRSALDIAGHHAERARQAEEPSDRAWHRELSAIAIAEATPVDRLAALVLDELDRRVRSAARAVRRPPARREPVGDALGLWGRELAAGRRTAARLDSLWRAAASQAAARDAQPGTPSEAALVERCNAALNEWVRDRRAAA